MNAPLARKLEAPAASAAPAPTPTPAPAAGGPAALQATLQAKLASAFPQDLSHSPWLGVLGVLLGAGIVSLAGRLLGLGLPDLKGNVGIGFDEGAWISSAFNVALMFIGPFTVYLGGLLGARRVLVIAAAIFTLVSACLPFVHNYSALIVLLVIAGLSSGTFYPLTLTFALRSVPVRYLALMLGLYATVIESAVNFGPSLYGFYRDHLSWHWMFWTSVIITPVMLVCVYYGIPSSPPPRRSGQAPSFRGFLYASAGLAMLYAALDQGQRLDWWRSGLFTALVAGGLFFLACALARRLRQPNPLVDLPYLRNWNTQILAVVLFAFRFVLLATIVIIPQSLSVRGFDASHFGPAVVWTAAPDLLLAVVAAFLLNRGLDNRLLLAVGFTAIGFACLMNADFTTAWSAENYFRTELLMSIGQSFALVGLVTSLVLQAVFSGGATSPTRALTFAAFFHTVRLFGGEVGVAMMGRFIAEREKLHSFLIGLHVQPGDWISEHTVKGLTAALSGKSAGVAAAAARATAIVDSKVRLEAYTLTFIDGFHLIAWTCVCALILIALLRRSPLSLGDLAFPRRVAATPKD